MKTFALGITIGAVFGGANAFGSALKSTNMLNSKLQELKEANELIWAVNLEKLHLKLLN